MSDADEITADDVRAAMALLAKFPEFLTEVAAREDAGRAVGVIVTSAFESARDRRLSERAYRPA